jgi:hypothetical protein
MENRATEINFPVEAVVEMALAGYLDSEAITSGIKIWGLDRVANNPALSITTSN